MLRKKFLLLVGGFFVLGVLLIYTTLAFEWSDTDIGKSDFPNGCGHSGVMFKPIKSLRITVDSQCISDAVTY